MFHFACDKKYEKFKSNMSTITEYDENSPSNYQIESLSEDIDCFKIEPPIEIDEDFTDANKSIRISDITELNHSLNHSYVDDEGTVEKTEKTQRRLSEEFGEVDCGEPVTSAQHLTIDFTISKDDTEFTQQKCCDFWRFIYSMPQFKHLMVVPESDGLGTVFDEISEENVNTRDKASAVDFLQQIGEGPVPSSFVAKQPPICENKNFPAYCHDSCTHLTRAKSAKQKRFGKNVHSKVDIASSRKKFVKRICSQMEEWDLQHPKSYDPPQLVPDLSQEAVIQGFPSSEMAQKELQCSNDIMCLPCSADVEEADLGVDNQDRD